MRKLSVMIMIALCSLYLASCTSKIKEDANDQKIATPTFDKQWAKAFIDSVNQKFSEQIKAGDSVALASHYWPDAELLLSNDEAKKGKDILSSWGSLTRMGIKDFTFSTTDITGDAEFLIETGTYEMKDDKQTLVDKGKYVVIWQQRNGEWKLYRDIGNTNLPVAK